MRVQFIWPNFDCPIGPSVGISYLSGALLAKGHDTRIEHICEWLDRHFDIDRIVGDVRDYDPGLIAFSTGDNHYPEMRQLAKALKERVDVPIVFGGVHPTLNAATILVDNPYIDFVNVGEGDDSLPELVNTLESGEDPGHIANLACRRDGRVQVNPVRPLKNLCAIPWMDLEGWEFERITENRRGWVNVYMNRGCPYRCTYCHNNGVAKLLQESLGTETSSNDDLGYLRLRGIDDMLGELKSILNRYDCVKAFSFNDDTFTMNQEYMKKFLIRYKAEIGIPFVCNTTVLDVDREMLEVMKDTNCELVRFGVEAASTRIKRDVLKRDFSEKKTEEVFQICRELGLRSFAYNLLANPTESREEMLATVDLNARIKPDGLKVSLGYPYPGTEYHDIAQAKGLIENDKHIHNFIRETKLKWSPEDRLWIDKMRAVYWWWLNRSLGNEASPAYAELVKLVEGMSETEWCRPETEPRLWELDDALSQIMKQRRITHYTIPYKDRPEISILFVGDSGLDREVLDDH